MINYNFQVGVIEHITYTQTHLDLANSKGRRGNFLKCVERSLLPNDPHKYTDTLRHSLIDTYTLTNSHPNLFLEVFLP